MDQSTVLAWEQQADAIDAQIADLTETSRSLRAAAASGRKIVGISRETATATARIVTEPNLGSIFGEDGKFSKLTLGDAAHAILTEAKKAVHSDAIYTAYVNGGGKAAKGSLGPALSRHTGIKSLGNGMFTIAEGGSN